MKELEELIKAIQESDNPEEHIRSLFKTVDEYKILGSIIVDWIIATVGPELNKILVSITNGIINMRSDTLSKYMSKGFSREEAILFMINDSISINKAMKNYEKNLKKM